MYNLHERWTIYDNRDGICGSQSRLISTHSTLEEAFHAQDILMDEIHSYEDVDSFVTDAKGNQVYRPRPVTEHKFSEPGDIPF